MDKALKNEEKDSVIEERVNFIEAPFNTFQAQTIGLSGERMYWSPIGSLYPVCPEGVEKKLICKLFDEATLAWADYVCPVDIFLIETAHENDKDMVLLKQEAFEKAILFTSISDIPLDEAYFEDNYCICYFSSKPYKLTNNTYLSVGVIGD